MREVDSLRAAAEVLADGCRGVTVTHSSGVDPMYVRELARAWLRANPAVRLVSPLADSRPPSWWERLQVRLRAGR